MKIHVLLILVSSMALNAWSQDSLFTKVLFQSSADLEAHAVLSTADGGLLVAGGSGFDAGIVCKVDSLGNYIWNKVLDFQSPLSNEVAFNQLIETVDNDYIAVGRAINNTNLQYEGYILKFNQLGDTLWSKSLGIANNTYYEVAAVTETNDGGYAIAGNINFGDSIFVGKLTSSGNIDWMQILDVGNDSTVFINAIKATANNGLYVSGYNDSITAVKFATLHHFADNGTYEWTKKYRDAKSVGLEITNQGVVLLAVDLNTFQTAVIKADFNGENASETIFFGQDAQAPERLRFHMKADSSWVFMNPTDLNARFFSTNKAISTATANKSALMLGLDIVEATSSNLFVVGNGPVLGIKALTQKHIGIIKVDENLNNLAAVCLDMDNQINIISNPIETFAYDFTAINGLNSFTNPVFISSQNLDFLNDCVSFLGSVDEQSLASLITIYPNVSTGIFHVVQAEVNDIELSVFDALGQKVHHQEFHGFTIDIDLSNQKAGIYFYQMKDAKNRIASGKLILMN